MKKVCIACFVLGISLIPLIFPKYSYAETEQVKERREDSVIIIKDNELSFDGIIENSSELPDENQNPTISSRMVNPIRYRKKNVKSYQEWSGYRRISDNLKTGAAGGSISATKTTTFGVSVSGDISGINVNASGSVSSAKGYKLNVGANKRVYLGYRTRYAVETGKREQYDLETGKVYRTNNYTVKRPLYGEYALINY